MIKSFSLNLTLETESDKELATVTVAAKSGPLSQALDYDGLALAVASVVEKKVKASLPENPQAKQDKAKIEHLQALVTELEAAAKRPVLSPSQAPADLERPRHRRSKE